MKKIKKSFLILSACFVLVLGGRYFLTSAKSFNVEEDIKKSQFQQLKESIEYYVKDYSGNISVYIKDLKTGQTVAINEEHKIPAASIIKIPIMAAVYHLQNEEKDLLEKSLVYEKRHRCAGSGKLKFFPCKTKFQISNLIELMITESDNIATNIITEYIGLDKLNQIFVSELNLKNTNMQRYIMDLKLRDKGIENYTSAKDIGIMLERIYNRKLISQTASEEMLEILMKQKISDRIPKYLPKEIVVAHKTGLMRDSCHDAGIVFTSKGDFIVVVLTEQINITLAKNVIAEIAYKTYSVYQ